MLAVAGCGGDDEPPKLEGPATLTSVNECIEESGLFAKVSAIPNAEKGEGLLFGKYEGSEGLSGEFGLTFYLTEQKARSIVKYQSAYNKGTKDVSILAETPTIIITYNTSIPDDGLAALKVCTKEDY
jgi:hypothetical protein